MNKIFSKLTLLAVASVAAMSVASCGDELKPYPWIVDDPNKDNPELEDVTMDVIEGEMRSGIPFMLNYSHEPTGSWAPHKYQYYRANSIDNYAGYWTTTKANFAFGPALPTLYFERNAYMSGSIDTQIFQQLKNALTQSSTALYDGQDEVIPRPEWRAIALICEAFAMHEIVDFYGVAAYKDWREVKRTIPINYEAGAEVYKQLLADLDEAIDILKVAKPDQATLQRVEGVTANKTCTDWQWQYWVKFANSIKLRMALNMVDYVDPDPVYGPDSKPFVPQSIAEEAVADEIGVLLPTDAIDIAYRSHDTWDCCVYTMGKSWNDIRLCASFENILKHFNNPMLEILFDPNSYQIKDPDGVVQAQGIYGVRVGLMMEDTGQPDAGGYGPFAALSDRQKFMDQPFFKRTEATFLRAEGALRGWNMGGDAKDLYEQGIRLCLKQWGCTDDQVDQYLAQDNLPVVDYVDGYHLENSCPGRVSVGVKWNESDSKELKLEKLITQKWIAVWPCGAEAWTTFRRTGYPRLFPVRFNQLSDVDTEMQIRRMTFEATNNNAAEVSQITELLGGTQGAGTRVFWDVRSASWGKDGNGWIVPQNF